MKQSLPTHDEITVLCDSIRMLITQNGHTECYTLIAEAMRKYPHSPHPHNLMGILFEIMNDHSTAMKHFRAAWSLDPTYIPARHNLSNFASFYSVNKFVFDENDIP